MTALLALLSSLLWGTSDFLGGTATRRLPVRSVLLGSQLVALLALVPIVLVLGADGTSYVVPGILAGLAGMAALGAFYRALATGTMGVVAPVAALGVVLPVGVGLAQGEQPSGWQLAGIAVAVAGVVLASGPELSGGAGARPLLLALGAAAGFGLVIVLVARGSAGGGVGRVVLLLGVMRLSSVLVLGALHLVLRPPAGRRPAGLGRADAPVVAAIGLGDVGANAAYAVSSRSGLLSVVAVLASLYPVVTVLLARQVHGERLQRLQAAGVVATLGGVVLLAAG